MLNLQVMCNLVHPSGDIRPVPAAGIVCLRGESVLLVRRATPPRQGEWSIPGGRIEPGETARAAALRELKEETGIEAELGGVIDVVDAMFKTEDGDLTHHYVLIDYVATWTAGEPLAGDDAADAQFFPLTDIPALGIWPETTRIINQGAAIARRAAKA